MTATLYLYPKCSTCVNARRWLAEQGVETTEIDMVRTPPSAETLKELHGRSGLPLKRFFNTSGESYRNGGFKDRLETMSDDEQFAALSADGKLIKRPVLVLPDRILVGFRIPEWEAAIKGQAGK